MRHAQAPTTAAELLRWGTRVLGLIAAALIFFTAALLSSLLIGAFAVAVAAGVLLTTRPVFWWAEFYGRTPR